MDPISLPPWPMSRLLSEACAYWNIQHPEAPADPVTSNWPLLYNAVHAYLRHEQTGYDRALTAGADRDALRHQITQEAATRYRWLRVERDPRTPEQSRRKENRPLNRFSRQLADLTGDRAQLTQAIAHERRTSARGWQERLKKAQERLENVNAQIKKLNSLFFTPTLERREDGMVQLCTLVHMHGVPGYSFAERELPPNYTRSAGFKCPQCGMTVLRSKCPVPVGAGRQMVAFSCHCYSLLLEGEGRHAIDLAYWQSISKHETKIMLYDDKGLLYGHGLAKEIAEGRRKPEEVTKYYGVKPGAFFDLLEVRFGDHQAVQAIAGDDEVSDEQLERISREIVLTSGDVEVILEVQERVYED